MPTSSEEAQLDDPHGPLDGGAGASASRLRRDVQLVRMLAPRELRLRYRQSLLDISWALIGPVVVLAVYGYILTRSFDVSAACGPYLSSTWAGLVVWTFFATSSGAAVTSLVSSSDLLTKVYFPRESIPLAVTGATLADLAVGLVTLAVVMAVQRVGVSWTQFFVVLPLAVLVVWTAAVAVLTSVLATFARDVVHGVHLALRVGFFATPVMYDQSLLPRPVRWTADVSPLAAAIAGVRSTLLCHEAPAWGVLGIQLAVGTAVLAAAVTYVARVESRIVDVL